LRGGGKKTRTVGPGEYERKHIRKAGRSIEKMRHILLAGLKSRLSQSKNTERERVSGKGRNAKKEGAISWE